MQNKHYLKIKEALAVKIIEVMVKEKLDLKNEELVGGIKKIIPSNKIFYTTGRLTSEMIIKTVKMRIPILISRNGFTSWGVDLAKKSNLTLIGRTKGSRFLALSGHQRIIYDKK